MDACDNVDQANHALENNGSTTRHMRHTCNAITSEGSGFCFSSFRLIACQRSP